jgi:uncharacterized protein (TIGR00730 family)
MKVTVFGGSHPTESDYASAQELGRMLGEAGHTVLTGGYIGTMEAVSRGAAEAGAHVIGVTCDEIERWRPLGPNAWVKEEMRFPTLRERLYGLIELSEAAIALPGGPGTLAEIAMVWNHLVISVLPPRWLILVGNGWKNTFETLFVGLDDYIAVPDRRWLVFAEDVTSAVEKLSAPIDFS